MSWTNLTIRTSQRRTPVLARCAALALAVLAALAAPAYAQEAPPADSARPEPFLHRSSRGGEFSMFQGVRVPAGTAHEGDLVCIFGDVEIDGSVGGEVVVIFGNLSINGSVDDNVVAILSNVSFGENSRVDGDFVNVLGGLAGEGRVAGDRVHIPFFFVPPSLWAPFGMLGTLLTWVAVVWTAVLFVLMIVLTAAVPDRIRIIAAEPPGSLPLAFLVGLGAYIALFLVNFALVATVIGIPLAGMVWVLFLVFKWIGLAGIYLWIGRGIGRLFGRELSVLPAVLLGFLPFMLLQLVPVFLGGFGFLVALGIRVLFWLLLEIPAVGLAILTRGGGRPRAMTPLTVPVVTPVPAAAAPSPAAG